MPPLAVQSPQQAIQHITGAPNNDVVATIDQVAVNVGVPTALAEAMAKVESGFNPRAVGDHGTSFGIYQLHQGGMLGNLTPEQAFDPRTNARVSLSHLAAVLKLHPEYSPGKAAAESQRPADKIGYASKVNAALAGTTVPSGTGGGATGGATGGGAGAGAGAQLVDWHIPGTPWNVPSPSDIIGGAAGIAGDTTAAAAKNVLGWLAKPLEAIALIALGLVVIVIGLVVLAHAATDGGGGTAAAAASSSRRSSSSSEGEAAEGAAAV